MITPRPPLALSLTLSASAATALTSAGAATAHAQPSAVRLSPIAVLSALDHWQRRPESHTRVVGALLGCISSDGSTYEITDSFPIPLNLSRLDTTSSSPPPLQPPLLPFLGPSTNGPEGVPSDAQEDNNNDQGHLDAPVVADEPTRTQTQTPEQSEPTHELDMTHATNMFSLLAQTNQRESVIGWYSSGLEIDAASASMHDQIESALVPAGATRPAVHLVFDPQLSNSSFSLGTYVGKPICGLDRKPCGRIFVPIDIAVSTSSTDLAVLEIAGRAARPGAQGKALVQVSADLMHDRVQLLREKLDDAIDFVEKTVLRLQNQRAAAAASSNGILPPRCLEYIAPHETVELSQIGRQLAAACAATQAHTGSMAPIENEMEDLRMAIELAMQASKQMEISEKLVYGSSLAH